mmetsp:Transcript_23398/g.49815  ORF Transcript_23398/g.49815 Transcript_23398/m.49815 type:complete len:114 (-) Transcript_23398:16-357(-)
MVATSSVVVVVEDEKHRETPLPGDAMLLVLLLARTEGDTWCRRLLVGPRNESRRLQENDRRLALVATAMADEGDDSSSSSDDDDDAAEAAMDILFLRRRGSVCVVCDGGVTVR